MRTQSPIQHDEEAETLSFRYTVDGQTHEVWFEDAGYPPAIIKADPERRIAYLDALETASVEAPWLPLPPSWRRRWTKA